MYYCAESCNKCCEKMGKCCDEICNAFCEACGGCAQCIGKIFSRPFSFCVFLAIFFCLVPGGAGVYGYFLKEEPNCDPDPSIQCLVSGINLFLIFLFCIYCWFTLGKEYNEGTTRYAGGKQVKEKNMAERLFNMVCYDPGFCCACCHLIFALGWMFYGFSITGAISKSDPCRDNDNNALQIKIASLQNILIAIFIGGGIFLFLFNIML